MAKAKAKAKVKTIQIEQIRSGIGFDKQQKATLRGLGFGRLHQVVERPDTPDIRGMVHKVRHLVQVIGEPPAGNG